MYYPTGGVEDYIFSVVDIVAGIVVVIFLYRMRKNRDLSKYHDMEYLQTFSLPELRYLRLSADNAEDIDEIIQKIEKQTPQNLERKVSRSEGFKFPLYHFIKVFFQSF